MKKFLSVISGIFTKVIVPLGELTPFAGLFSSLFPGNKIVQTVGTDIKLALSEIANVESIITTPGTGVDKLKAAAPRVGVLFTTAIDDLGLKIDDEQAATTALNNITSNMADFLNACKKK